MSTEKKTRQLENEILQSSDIESFLSENKSSIKEHNFSYYLRELLLEKGISATQIIKRTNIEKSYFYQILKGRRKPGRDKIILISIALALTKEETQKILKIGKERSLYIKDRRDVVLQYCIIKKYDVDKTQAYLENNGFEILA